MEKIVYDKRCINLYKYRVETNRKPRMRLLKTKPAHVFD